MVAVLSVVPLQHWPPRSLLTLLVVAGLAAIGCGVRVAMGTRLPRWTLQVDVGIATMLASLLTAVGASGHVDFADLYVWIVLFAALYFRPRAALAWIAAVGAAYWGVLALGPRADDPVAAWLSLFGTAAVAAAVVLGLVTVLRGAAREDPLTGLANRRAWDERLDEELGRARRAGVLLSVAILDLDSFKAVNDRWGHEAGDHLLQQLAQAWQGAHRGGDFMARLGGDEFGLLVPGSDAIGIRRVMARLGEVLPEGVSFSSGVATWDGAETGQHLLRRADQAMYRMKQRSRLSVGRRDLEASRSAKGDERCQSPPRVPQRPHGGAPAGGVWPRGPSKSVPATPGGQRLSPPGATIIDIGGRFH